MKDSRRSALSLFVWLAIIVPGLYLANGTGLPFLAAVLSSFLIGVIAGLVSTRIYFKGH